MEISAFDSVQVVAITLGLLSVAISVFVFFTRAESSKAAWSKLSSSATLIAILIAFSTLFYANIQDERSTFFASLACQADQKYAPTKITCLNQSSEFETVSWSVNGSAMQGTGEFLVFDAAEAGQYQVEMKVLQSGLLKDLEAVAGELVLVGAREAFEREISSTHRLFFPSKSSQTFRVDAPNGFVVDEGTLIVKLEQHRGDIQVVNQSVDERGVTVTVLGIGRIGVSGLKIRNDPAEGILIIAYTARRQE